MFTHLNISTDTHKSNFVTAFPRKIFCHICTIDSMDLNFAVDCIWLILQSECNRLDWREYYWLLQTCLLCIQRFRLRKVISYGILTISIRLIVTFRMTHGTFQLINMYNSNEMKSYCLCSSKRLKKSFSISTYFLSLQKPKLLKIWNEIRSNS